MEKSNSVGGFQNHSKLKVHTFEALQLIEGKKINESHSDKKTYQIPSAKVFGIIMTRLNKRAALDDPYAEYALIETERLIDRAFKLLNQLDRQLDKDLKKSLLPEELTLTLSESKNSREVSMSDPAFTTTHAKLIIMLIGTYDLFVRKLKTYKSFGIISGGTAKTRLRRATKGIRTIIMASVSFPNTLVTRKDLIDQTSEGLAALENFGMIPFDVLKGGRQSVYGPAATHSYVQSYY